MKKSWKTKLIHSDRQVPGGFRSLATPTYRGSTVLFSDAKSVNDHWDQEQVGYYTYGLYGTPTVLELAARVCELEGGAHTLITPGGQGSIALIQFALLKAGDHVLIPENIYSPNRKLAHTVLRRFGVEVTLYAPLIGGRIAEHLPRQHPPGVVRKSRARSLWRCRMFRQSQPLLMRAARSW